MKETLNYIYEKMDELTKRIDEVDNLELKNISIEEYNDLKYIAQSILNLEIKPVAIKYNGFIRDFTSIQERLDFINSKLKVHNILDGTIELFTSLAYTSIVSSYSSLNLHYIEYKFPKIFGQDIDMIYENDQEDLMSEEIKNVLLESFDQLDLIYEETEEKIINPGFENEEEYLI